MKAIYKNKIKKLSSSPFGVMFHHFHNNNSQKYGQGSINKKEFEKIIIFLRKNFNLLNPNEWVSKLENENLRKKDICITFDDAILSQYTIALKILDKYKIKAFWFVYSSVFEGKIDNFEIHRKFRSKYYKNFDKFYDDFIIMAKLKNNFFNNSNEYRKFYKKMKKFYPIYSLKDIKFRYIRDYVLDENSYNKVLKKMMNYKKTSLKKLSKNLWLKNYHLKKLSDKKHIIGMHAYNHPYKLSNYKYEEQYKELKKNYKHLKNVLNIKPISISYPNGSFNNITLKIIKKLKVKFGFISSISNYNNIREKNYIIKRLDHSIIIKNFLSN